MFCEEESLAWSVFIYPLQYRGNFFIFETFRKRLFEVPKDVYSKAISNEISGINKDHLNFLINNDLLVYKERKSQFKEFFERVATNDFGKLTLHITTSYRCNLKCDYCFMLSPKKTKNEKLRGVLNEKDVYKTIDMIFMEKEYVDELNITFYGGEPLLDIGLIENSLNYIVDNYIEKVGSLNPYIITNATLIEKNKGELLRLFKNFNFDISISLDGDNKANDIYRVYFNGKSSHSDVVKGFDILRSTMGSAPKILITVGEHNIERLNEIVEHICSLQPKAIALNFPRYIGYDDLLESKQKDEEYWINKYIQALDTCYDNKIPELYFSDMLLNFFLDKPKLKPCAACENQISIAPGNRVGPCHVFLAHDKFFVYADDLFDHDKAKVFDEWRDISKMKSRMCSNCNISPLCIGDCPFDRYNRVGNLLDPLPFHCLRNKRMVEYLIKRIIDGKSLSFR